MGSPALRLLVVPALYVVADRVISFVSRVYRRILPPDPEPPAAPPGGPAAERPSESPAAE